MLHFVSQPRLSKKEIQLFFVVTSIIQGAGTRVLHEIGHLGWSCECGCALLPLFVPHLGFKSKNNVKFCNSASYKYPKCIYYFIVPTLDIFGQVCLMIL